MKAEITIIIADDHALVRKGLREVIEEEGDLRIIAEASNGKEAVEAVEKHQPRIAVIDIDMPLMNGFDAVRKIKEKRLNPEIIFLTMHRDEDIFNKAVDLGAKGFVLKESALGDITDCIRAVAAGGRYTSHALTSFLFSRRRTEESNEKTPTIQDLTSTERRVLKLIAENFTSKEIGDQLFISLRTVEKHRQNICRKLNLQGSHSLFKFAITIKAELL